MMDVVDHGTGRVAQLPGIEVCAKTGTVENKARIYGKVVKLQNHSMFVAFAPRVHPKIAIAVAVENAGYGSTWAGPIASLMIEKYLTNQIAQNRTHLEKRMKNTKLIPRYTYVIDSQQRERDARIWNRKQEAKRVKDSINHVQDSIAILQYFKKTFGYTPPVIRK